LRIAGSLESDGSVLKISSAAPQLWRLASMFANTTARLGEARIKINRLAAVALHIGQRLGG